MKSFDIPDSKYVDTIRCRVAMLPQEPREIWSGIPKDRGYWIFDGLLVHNSTPQHLYLISRRNAKEGEWVEQESRIYKMVLPNHYQKKIEATTDPSLNLPLIHQDDIRKYVEMKGNVEEVLVEAISMAPDAINLERLPDYTDWDIILKTKADGTAIIHQVKANWNREELREIASKFSRYCVTQGNVTTQDIINSFDDWFNKNY